MSEVIKLTKLTDFKCLEQQLKEKWLDLEQNSNAFRYKLNVQQQKTLDGKSHFVAQLNTERNTLRRKPQTMTSVTQPFDEKLFNFNKVNECEILLRCENQLNPKSSGGTTTFLVNNSPLTKFHSLICPRLSDNLAQVITKDCIEFAIDLVTGLDDRSYRIGFNGLGAFASVNHLHIHLLHVPEKLFIEDAQISEISNGIYRLDYPSFAFCLPVFQWSKRGAVADKLLRIVEYFCQKSIPHNIFWTLGTHAGQQIVKMFIFPRNNLSHKPESTFNVAFCELSGYVPVGDAEVYENLTEDFLVEKIAEAIGEVDHNTIISEVMALFPGDDRINNSI